MDFFEAQEQARRNTGRLVVLLVLAVLCLIAVTVLVVSAVIFVTGNVSSEAPSMQPGAASQELSLQGLVDGLEWQLVAGVAALVIAVVALGSLFKRLQLNAGGRAVAESLGGRLINVNTRDADERKILNVVEEMSIASGTPVPPVYVLEDESINAFAAGHKLEDAVIGVTRGSIQQLSRAELQGVVAHEFSHIMHGDMRLNMRLIAILHGILVIGLAGQSMLYSMRFRRLGGGRRDNSAMVVLALAVALMLIGYAGTFFGNLIKAAVSRQREYLADASAVQFTRYPESIGGALVKIGANQKGSQLESSHAAEFSHMYFSQGVTMSFRRMMATHPPLEDRIRRVMPGWDGRFQVSAPAPEPEVATEDTQEEPVSRRRAMAGVMAAGAVLSAQSANVAIQSIGQPGDRHLAWAQETLHELSEHLREAAHDPFAARALIYALLLNPDQQARSAQLQALEAEAAPEVYRELMRLADDVMALSPRFRLPLIELALPALKELSFDAMGTFKRCMALLIRSDGKVSLMEWALYQIVTHNIDPQPTGAVNQTLLKQQDACEVLISVLARAGQDTAEEAEQAVRAANSQLPFTVALRPLDSMGAADLTTAVNALRRLKPMEKPALLKAMARCIEHSGEVRPIEAELFRAMGEVLDCPMPPLLADPSGD